MFVADVKCSQATRQTVPNLWIGSAGWQYGWAFSCRWWVVLPHLVPTRLDEDGLHGCFTAVLVVVFVVVSWCLLLLSAVCCCRNTSLTAANSDSMLHVTYLCRSCSSSCSHCRTMSSHVTCDVIGSWRTATSRHDDISINRNTMTHDRN